MKYSFQAFLLVYILVALANSNQTTNTARRCNINNHYTFSAGPNCKKIENVMFEVKQHLAELKQQIKDMKENKTEGPTGKGLQLCFVEYILDFRFFLFLSVSISYLKRNH